MALITALAAADGGVHSPVALVYFLTLVFAALAYPLASVVVVSAASVIACAVLALVMTEPTDRTSRALRTSGFSPRASRSWARCASGRPGSATRCAPTW